MKKKYETPYAELAELESEDILTESLGEEEDKDSPGKEEEGGQD